MAKTVKAGVSQSVATYVPDVDIFEDSEQIRLVADIPGASQADVEVTVENNVLTINAAPRAAHWPARNTGSATIIGTSRFQTRSAWTASAPR
jgi:HSP20 family molecular chaperone IbpA